MEHLLRPDLGMDAAELLSGQGTAGPCPVGYSLVDTSHTKPGQEPRELPHRRCGECP